MAEKYIATVGRRKTASARVRLTPASKQSVIVNGKDIKDYFSVGELVRNALLPLKDVDGSFTITAVISGGGISGQAHALRHGIARALIVHDASKRTILKKGGHLKRDPRAVERKKPGRLKARKKPSWSKR